MIKDNINLKDNQENSDILTYDNLISFGFVTEKNDMRKNCHLIIRKQDLEEGLVFQRCNINSDVGLLKESLFQIKRPVEKKENITSDNKSNEKVDYNSFFNLYHIVSKKYLTIEKNSSKNYILKLVSDEVGITSFNFKTIVETKSTSTAVMMSQFVYLCGYIKEKSQYYFIDVKLDYTDKIKFSEINSVTRNSTKEYKESTTSSLETTLKIKLTQNRNSKVCLFDNSRFKETLVNYLNLGDIINICFSYSNEVTEMLCVKNTQKENTNLFKLKEEQREDINKFKINIFDEEIKQVEKNIYRSKSIHREEIYEVVSCRFFEDIYNHVENNSLWVLEKDYGDSKEPVRNRDRVRIKNFLLNLYLAITETKNKNGEKCLGFTLVEDKALCIENGYLANFEIISYSNSQKGNDFFSGDNIKIYLRTSKYDSNHKDYPKSNSIVEKSQKFKKFFYQLFSFHIEKEKDSNMLIVNEDEYPNYTYEIKKVPIQKGHESIYIKNIMNKLVREILEKNSSKSYQNIEMIIKHLNYYENYLLNLNESFYDSNYPKNIPIHSRQVLLENYKIFSIISQILHFFNSSTIINDTNKKFILEKDPFEGAKDNIKEQFKTLWKKILCFLTFLCYKNPSIQEKIFDTILKDFFQFNMDNYTIIIFTLFKILKNNQVIQEKLFDISINKKENTEKQHPINFKLLLDWIVKSSFPYLFYKKVLNFKNLSELKEHGDIIHLIKKENERLKKSFKDDSEKIKSDSSKCYILLDFFSKLNIKEFIFIKDFVIGNTDFLNEFGEEDLPSKREKRKLNSVIECCKNEDLSEVLNNLDKEENENSIKILDDISVEINNDKTPIIKLIEKSNDEYIYKNLSLNLDEKKKIEVIPKSKKDNKYVKSDSLKISKDLESFREIVIKKKLCSLVINLVKGLDNLSFDLFFKINHSISLKNYESDFKIKINTEAALNFPTLMLNFFFPDFDDTSNKIKEINEEEKKKDKYLEEIDDKLMKKIDNNLKDIDSKSTNKIVFFYQFCLLKFFGGIYYILKILKNYYTNFLKLNEVKEVENKINEIKKRTFEVIAELNVHNTVVKMFHDIQSKNIKIKDFIEFLKMNKFDFKNDNKSDNSYWKNDEEQFYNIYYMFKLILIFEKIEFFFNQIKFYHESNLEKFDNREDKFKYLKLFQSLDSLKMDHKTQSFYKCTITIKNELFTFLTNMINDDNPKNFKMNLYIIENREKFHLIKGFIKYYTNINYDIERFEITLRKWNIEKINDLILYFKENLKKLSSKLNELFKKRNKNTNLISLKNRKTRSEIEINNDIKNDDFFRKINFKNFLNKLINLITFDKHDKIENFDSKLRQINWDNYFELAFFIMKLLLKMYKYDENPEKKLTKHLASHIKFLEIILQYAHDYSIKKHHNTTSFNPLIEEENEERDQTPFDILKLYYESSNIFLFFIKHSSFLKFEVKKEYIERIVKKQLFPVLVNHKLIEIQYLQFYVIIICKLLLVLFKDKNFDNYEYEEEFKSIFNPHQIKMRLFDYIKDCNNIYKENHYEKIRNDCIEEDKNNSEDLDIIKNEEIFILNFLISYCVYLNELNLMRNSKDLLSKQIKIFNFSKQKLIQNIDKYLDLTDIQKNLIDTQKGLADTHKFKPKITNYYQYEVILLEAILEYKLKKLILETKVIKDDNNYFLFYTDIIDLFLIEKIFTKVGLNKNIKNLFYKQNENIIRKQAKETGNRDQKLIRILIEEKRNFMKIMSKTNKEINIYNQLLHDQFLNNHMLKFIDTVLVNYSTKEQEMNWNDTVKYFDYIRFNELYNNYKSMDDNSSYDNYNIFNEAIKNKNFKNRIVTFNSLYTNKWKIRPSHILNDLENDILIRNLRYVRCIVPSSHCKYIFEIIFNTINNKIDDRSNNEQTNYNSLLEELNHLFCIQENKKILLNNHVYFPALNLLNKLLNKIFYNEKILNLYIDSIRVLLSSLDFIFDNLDRILKSLSEFLESDDNQSKINEFSEKVKKLNVIVEFMKIIVSYNAKKNLKLETEFMRNFNTKILKKLIEIIFILLNFNDVESYETINILLDFILNFVQGPEVDNLILLFNSGFLRLVIHLISSIDYAEIIINNINNNMIFEKVDSLIKIEYKIMMTFFLYFNVIHNLPSNKIHKQIIKNFYEENHSLIIYKIQKIFYILKIENGNDDIWNIDSLLLFSKDSNNIKFSEEWTSKYKNPLIKFELILIYYSLFMLYNETILERYNLKEINTIETWEKLYNAIVSVIDTFIKSIFFPISIFSYLMSIKTLIKIDRKKATYKNYMEKLFEKIYENNEFCRKNDINSIISFLQKHISGTEIVLNDIIYKIYFPIVKDSYDLKNKMDKIELPTEESQNYENYVYLMLNRYDEIKIIQSNNYKINKLFKVLFSNMKFLRIIMLILAFILNFIILNSYSNFKSSRCPDKDDNYKRLNCPSFFNIDTTSYTTQKVIGWMGIIQIIISSLVCFNYFIKKYNITLSKATLLFNKKEKEKQNNILLNSKIEEEKNSSNYSEGVDNKVNLLAKYLPKINFSKIYYSIIHPVLFTLLNLESIYNLAYLTFAILGIVVHPFFFGLLLCEAFIIIGYFKNVIYTIYYPRFQILVTLFLFFICLYFFILVGIRMFPDDYPNFNDTSSLVSNLLRGAEQTFKADSGIGGYMRQFDDSFYLNLTITRNTFNNDPNVTVINENLTSNESDPKLSIVKYFNSTSLQIETKTFYLSAADFPYKFSRLIFDQLFNLLILMLIMQMFLSIIKDFFSRKREEHEKFEEYTKKNCLLCGIGREKIERLYMSHKDAFDIHIKRDHNINDVICYLNYLELKNFNELDKNTESEVLKMHKEKKYSYIPKKICFKKQENQVIQF